MKTIVISGVNIRRGGTLTILRECLTFLSAWAPHAGYRVIALVHRRELVDLPNIEYIEMPHSAASWFNRLRCEYIEMGRVAEQLGTIELWFSLHDTTPRVKAKRQALYCQTSFPFFRWHWSDFRFSRKIPLFGILTRYAYQFGLHRNDHIVVQQDWLRRGFSKMFRVPYERFIVAPPESIISIPDYTPLESDGRYTFFFASTADIHKSFETLCLASELLESRIGRGRFRTIITVRGDEHPYAQYLWKRWGGVSSIEFAGLMDKPTLYAHYAMADCFVFPSRIETWGLPITEFIQTNQTTGYTNKPILVSDLPYAHETTAGAKAVGFFPPEDAERLAQMMQQLIEGDTSVVQPSCYTPAADAIHTWQALFEKLLAE